MAERLRALALFHVRAEDAERAEMQRFTSALSAYSARNLSRWTDERFWGGWGLLIIPVAKRWGGGPRPKGVVEGRYAAPMPDGVGPLRQRFALPPPHGFATGRIIWPPTSACGLCGQARAEPVGG